MKDRKYMYMSMVGITEEELQEELMVFFNRLNNKYAHQGFGATVLGIEKPAALVIEKMLHENEHLGE